MPNKSEITYKIYPFPYLIDGTKDYKKTTFNLFVNAEASKKQITLNIGYKINNEELMALIAEETLKVTVEIRSKLLGFVKYQDFPFSSNAMTVQLDNLEVEGQISIQAYLISERNLHLENQDITNGWEQINPLILKNNVIGESDVRVVTVQHSKKGTKRTIFSFVSSSDIEDKDGYKVFFDRDKIIIKMNRIMYRHFKTLECRDDSLVIVAFIIPIMTEILTYMKETNDLDVQNDFNSAYENKNWYKVIESNYFKAFGKYPSDVDNNIEPIYAAQQLFKGHLDASLVNRINGGNNR